MTERRRARRCPYCGMVNQPTAQSCGCGFHFDDPERMRDLLRGQVATGWTLIIFGLLLSIGALSLAVLASWIAGVALVGTVAMFTKGTRILDAAKTGLRELPQLPEAKVR